jgi:hypothetical protein
MWPSSGQIVTWQLGSLEASHSACAHGANTSSLPCQRKTSTEMVSSGTGNGSREITRSQRHPSGPCRSASPIAETGPSAPELGLRGNASRPVRRFRGERLSGCLSVALLDELERTPVFVVQLCDRTGQLPEHEVRRRRNEARARDAVTEEGCIGDDVRTASRIAGDCEALETKCVTELGYVRGPVFQTAAGLHVGSSKAGPVDGDDANARGSRCLFVRAPKSRERGPVKEEDVSSVRIAPLGIGEGATTTKPQALVSDRLSDRALHCARIA